MKTQAQQTRDGKEALVGTYKGVRFCITAAGSARDPYRVTIGKWSIERMRKRDIYSAIKEHVNENY